MRLTEVFNAKAIADNYTEAASNAQPYLGQGFFPSHKKRGLDLKWIKGHKGLPVSLMPSNFDAKSTFRDRVGIELAETRMAYFKESMLIKEEDRQEILRAQEPNDPYVATVIERIFDDKRALVEGADVVPERMRMQLLAPIDGNMGIEVSANGVNYTYNFDPDGQWKKDHYMNIESAEDMWNAPETCDPLADIENALDSQQAASGNRPEILLMSKATFKLLKNSKRVQSGVLAQNVTANIFYSDKLVQNFVEEALNVKIVIYTKLYKDENDDTHAFYPDNIIMMLPNGDLGKTWYGSTPDEVDFAGSGEGSFALVNTGVAVSTTTTHDPVNVKTTVSEIVLPSFERMDECYALQVVTA